jgi:hypothetical protein
MGQSPRGDRSPPPISSLRTPPARSSGSVHDGRWPSFGLWPTRSGSGGCVTGASPRSPPGPECAAGSFDLEARRTFRPGLDRRASSTWTSAEPHQRHSGDIPRMEGVAGEGRSGKGGVQKNEPPAERESRTGYGSAWPIQKGAFEEEQNRRAPADTHHPEPNQPSDGLRRSPEPHSRQDQGMWPGRENGRHEPLDLSQKSSSLKM